MCTERYDFEQGTCWSCLTVPPVILTDSDGYNTLSKQHRITNLISGLKVAGHLILIGNVVGHQGVCYSRPIMYGISRLVQLSSRSREHTLANGCKENRGGKEILSRVEFN